MEIAPDSETTKDTISRNEVTPFVASQLQKIIDRTYTKFKDVDAEGKHSC